MPSEPVTDAATAVNILWRTQKIKALAGEFFAHFAHVQGVNLGAGLSDYFQWLDNGQNRWIDVDLPKVVALRQQLMPELPERAQLRSDDLRVAGWWDRLGLQKENHHNPLLLISERLLMYMKPVEVKTFFHEIGEHAPEGSLRLARPLGRSPLRPPDRRPTLRTGPPQGLRRLMVLAEPAFISVRACIHLRSG